MAMQSAIVVATVVARMMIRHMIVITRIAIMARTASMVRKVRKASKEHDPTYADRQNTDTFSELRRGPRLLGGGSDTEPSSGGGS